MANSPPKRAVWLIQIQAFVHEMKPHTNVGIPIFKSVKNT